MNNGYSKGSEIKMYFYLHRIQGNRLKEGEKYRPYKTTLIAFNNYRNPKVPELAIGYYKMTEQKTKVTKEDGVESYEISLPNYHEKGYNEIRNEIDKRLWLLGVEDVEEVKAFNLSEEDKRIIREYERLVEEDERYGLLYDAEKDQEKLIKSAHDFGYEEGEMQKALETAKTLLKMRVGTLEQIAKATGLSVEEIQELKIAIS